MADMEETIKAISKLYIMVGERERERREAVVNDFQVNFCLIYKNSLIKDVKS